MRPIALSRIGGCVCQQQISNSFGTFGHLFGFFLLDMDVMRRGPGRGHARHTWKPSKLSHRVICALCRVPRNVEGLISLHLPSIGILIVEIVGQGCSTNALLCTGRISIVYIHLVSSGPMASLRLASSLEVIVHHTSTWFLGNCIFKLHSGSVLLQFLQKSQHSLRLFAFFYKASGVLSIRYLEHLQLGMYARAPFSCPRTTRFTPDDTHFEAWCARGNL